MKNAPTVTLDDIIKRQYLIGLVNLFDTEPWKGGTYTKTELENRKNLIVNSMNSYVKEKQAV